MPVAYKLFFSGLVVLFSTTIHAQQLVKGRILDALTKEPIQGATIHCTDKDCNCVSITRATWEFELQFKKCKKVLLSMTGYSGKEIALADFAQPVLLSPANSIMNEIVVNC